MAIVRTTLSVAIVATVLYFSLNYYLFTPTRVLKIEDNHVWGMLNPNNSEIKPFKIEFPESSLTDLKNRLRNWRRPVSTLDGVDLEYGISLQKVASVIEYWRDRFDWRKAEKQLNELPQFHTIIRGLNIHFVHVKGENTAKIRLPLLLVHGWPGSFMEFAKVVPILTKSQDGIAFDVVVPSIPGYTFSESPSKPGCGPLATADIFQKLMARLGYNKFVYQGGDWGSFIGIAMANLFPDHLIGYHTNLMTPPGTSAMDILHMGAALAFPELVLGKEDAQKLSIRKILWIAEECGYFHEQATKPDTLGFGLSDSPSGLAAYMLEKFAAWSEHVEFISGKGLTNDEILTTITMYWLTNNITPSLRLYKETLNSEFAILAGLRTDRVPIAGACYPGDFFCAPREIYARNKGRFVQYSDMPRGGHFAAYEQPELFDEDLRKAVKLFLKIRLEEDKWKKDEF